MTGSETPGKPIFKKSSHSGGGSCVAVARMTDGSIGVRRWIPEDSTVILFNDHEWDAFVKGVKDGEFDRP